MTNPTDDARTCGPECAEAHTCAGRCLLAPLYPSIELETLRATLEEVRAWRHRQPRTDARRFADLDEILDRAVLGQIKRQLDLDVPTSLPEAVDAHHRVMTARRHAADDARRAWDMVEAEAIRQIARFMPATGVSR
jgi:hypothetical protein